MASYFVWIAAATVLLLVLELAAGRHRNVYREGDFKILAGSFLLGRGVMSVVATGMVAAIYGGLLPERQGSLAAVTFWAAFPVLLLLDEFSFYWVHRLAHEGWSSRPAFQWLWKIHRTHHSARHMNVLLNYRLNLFWYFLIPSAWVLGLALYLGQGEAVLAIILVKQVWNLVTHSHFRWDDPLRRLPVIGPVFRAMEHVLVSPGIHHTHHGYGRDGKSYRNFGVVLSLYDWLFGTLHIPQGRPARYGVPGHKAHWLEELLYPLVRADNNSRGK